MNFCNLGQSRGIKYGSVISASVADSSVDAFLSPLSHSCLENSDPKIQKYKNYKNTEMQKCKKNYSSLDVFSPPPLLQLEDSIYGP